MHTKSQDLDEYVCAAMERKPPQVQSKLQSLDIDHVDSKIKIHFF